MKRHNCPKCKENTIMLSVEEKFDCVEINIFKCLNHECNHQVMDIEELIIKNQSKKKTA